MDGASLIILKKFDINMGDVITPPITYYARKIFDYNLIESPLTAYLATFFIGTLKYISLDNVMPYIGGLNAVANKYCDESKQCFKDPHLNLFIIELIDKIGRDGLYQIIMTSITNNEVTEKFMQSTLPQAFISASITTSMSYLLYTPSENIIHNLYDNIEAFLGEFSHLCKNAIDNHFEL